MTTDEIRMTNPISRWTRFWHEPVRAEQLDAARVLFALALLADQLLQYLPNLAYFYGPEGVAPAGLFDDYALRNWRWTMLFFFTDDMAVVGTLFGVWVAATAGLLVGWHTRWMAAIVWLLTLCFINRNPNLLNGGDDTLQIGLFLLMIAPCGRSLSLDARRRRKAAAIGVHESDANRWASFIAPWPVRLFQIQLCVIYLTTGIAKLRGYDWFEGTWWDGTSVHYVINDVTMARWSYATLPLPFWVTATLTYASVWWEILFTPLVLWKRTRNWTLWFGILFHLGIYAMIEVGWFSFYTMAMYGPWIGQAFWDRYFGPKRRTDAGANEPLAVLREPAGPNDYRVYYDTLCPVCRRSRRALERLDWGGRLVFRDIHDRETMARELPGVSYGQALREMIVLSPRGKVTAGFDGFRALTWTLAPLWPIAWLLYLPGVGFVGRRVYRLIAKNRYRIAACDDGVCQLHLKALAAAELDEREIQRIVEQARGEPLAEI